MIATVGASEVWQHVNQNNLDSAASADAARSELRAAIRWTHERPQLYVGDGWLDLVGRCHHDLNVLIPDYAAVQVKSKFASLRYATLLTADVETDTAIAFRARIDQAEQEAARTCERCGRPGTLVHDDGGYAVLCPEHDPRVGRA